MRPLLLLGTIVLACIPSQGQSLSPHAQEAVRIIRELRAIGLPTFDAGDLGPPAKVPGLLRKLNSQLRELITETLNDHSRHSGDLQTDIIARLQAAGWEEIPEHKWNAYGEIRQIGYGFGGDRNAGLFVVSTQLWIPCGSSDPDTAIYVFQRSGSDWRLVLSADADFESTGELKTGMQYQLAPPDAKGNWYLAIAHSPPACGPTPSSFRYRILRPGPSPDAPQVLVNHSESLNFNFEPAFRLEAEADWFAVTRGKDRRLDGEPGIFIDRYGIDGDRMTRLQPLALTPGDFLDEWIQLDWSEAERWSHPSADANLSKWHSMLKQIANGSTEMRLMQPCREHPDADKSWLIGLWVDPKLNTPKEALYVLVSERTHTFFIDSVSAARPQGCPGRARPLATNWELPNW
jgi:hypothetical protein